MNIPKSNWKLDEVYFKVKPVDGFSNKYLHWLSEYNGGIDSDSIEFSERIMAMEEMEVYQFPFDSSSNNVQTVNYEEDADYFEREDDNHVIPRHLFEIINNSESPNS